MTISQIDPTTAPLVVDDAQSCTVCGHEPARHDAIARRYCEATQLRALQRGCICRPA
jgi:hypothetical protein